MRHEIVSKNPDIEVRFYLSENEGSYVPPHWHDSLELLCPVEGSITIEHEKKKTVVPAGTFCVVNSREIHSVLVGDNRFLVLQIPKEVMKKYVPDIELYYFDIGMCENSKEGKESLARMKKIFGEMYQVYTGRPEGYLLKFNSLLFELLFFLIQFCSGKVQGKDIDRNNRHLERLNDIMVYLKAHYREKCTISQLAEQFGYSEDYLSRFFKRQLGMTITEYLYAVRIARVYQDLMETNLSINAILEANGCSNYRVAMRTFKETYGCTPKEKRKERQKG